MIKHRCANQDNWRRFIEDPQKAYDYIRANLEKKQVTIPELFWCEDDNLLLGCWSGARDIFDLLIHRQRMSRSPSRLVAPRTSRTC